VSNKNENNMETNISRRAFVGAMATLAAAGGMGAQTVFAAQNLPPMAVSAINHMTLAVSDPAASLAWYQGLFGLPIVARQGGTIVLQVGDGPQFIAIGGNASDNPRITHYCLAVDNFDHSEAVQILAENGVEAANASAAMQSRVRMRGEEFGGAVNGTPELYFGDPDGIVVQLQDSSYCGGAGLLGEECLPRAEPAPTNGLLSIREFNHFTLFVTDQARSIQFYQSLFGLPIDTYQGALPVLRVGSGNQFLALSGQPSIPSQIHHASIAVEDFDVDRIFSLLESYGLTILGEARGANGPLQAYVTMRGANRGGVTEGTPELYFTDPDGILVQLQDLSYCGGNGYLGNECGTVANPTGRNN
jgi:catechol 2,3-dioxygenase-like lactoylglutathione lyase family enzyme|tara:strand:+ start:1209 stop:2288 length:1080 start_codon:yes stop_codon:yes gene_type:complete